MTRRLNLTITVVIVALTTIATTASARNRGTIGPRQGTATQIDTVASTNNRSLGIAIIVGQIYNGGSGGNQYGSRDVNEAGNKGHDSAPESSRMLSFGAALVIGGGVLYSRRARRKRN